MIMTTVTRWPAPWVSRQNRCPATALAVSAVILAALLPGGCGQSLDLGSNILWSAAYENGADRLSEWKNPLTFAFPADAGTSSPMSAGISMPSGASMVGGTSGLDPTHGSSAGAAKFYITGATNGSIQSQSLTISGNLPWKAAYYSSWYYIPQSAVTIGGPSSYWVIMKIRQDVGKNELYDFDLFNSAAGAGDAGTSAWSLKIYDWDNGSTCGSSSMVKTATVTADTWFHLEAFYSNGTGPDGHLTVWLDGVQFMDKPCGPAMGSTWVGWEVANIGDNLTPPTATLYADDSAISLTRVGPTGRISR